MDLLKYCVLWRGRVLERLGLHQLVAEVGPAVIGRRVERDGGRERSLDLDASEAPKAPVKAARPAKIKAPAESKVATADIAPVKKAAPKAKKPIDSPAPVEAIAPAKATPGKKATVKAA